MKKYTKLLSHFNITEEVIGVNPFGGGHINDTFLVTCPDKKYVLQRINHSIFKRPDQVMENISHVCDHLKIKVNELGGDVKREVMNLIQAKNGTYLTEYDGNFYRMYEFVENANSYQIIENPKLFYNAGKAFGKFQRLLSDFPVDTLYETIEKFDWANFVTDLILNMDDLDGFASGEKAGYGTSVTKNSSFLSFTTATLSALSNSQPFSKARVEFNFFEKADEKIVLVTTGNDKYTNLMRTYSGTSVLASLYYNQISDLVNLSYNVKNKYEQITGEKAKWNKFYNYRVTVDEGHKNLDTQFYISTDKNVGLISTPIVFENDRCEIGTGELAFKPLISLPINTSSKLSQAYEKVFYEALEAKSLILK